MTTGVTYAAASLKHLLETPILSTALNAEVQKLYDLYVRLASAEKLRTKPLSDMEYLHSALSQDPTTGVSK